MNLEHFQFPLTILIFALSVWLVSGAFKNVAAGIKIIMGLRGFSLKQKRERLKREMDRERTKLRHEVEPKFDLWWNMTGKAIVERNPLEHVHANVDLNTLPEAFQDGIKSQAVEALKSQAFEYAALLAGRQLHLAHVARMRSVLGNEAAAELDDSYERALEHSQEQFAAMGVDIDDFATTFGA